MTLKKTLALLAATTALALSTAPAQAQDGNIHRPDQVQKMADGSSLQLLSHDAGKVVLKRAWLPASKDLPPHGEVAEGRVVVVTVLAGELELAMGDQFDASKLQQLPVGSVVVLTHDHAMHFARTGASGAQLLLAESDVDDVSPRLLQSPR
jgi:hypothetical protein